MMMMMMMMIIARTKMANKSAFFWSPFFFAARSVGVCLSRQNPGGGVRGPGSDHGGFHG